MNHLIGAYWPPQTALTFRSDLLSCQRSLCMCICSLLALCALFCASLATWRSDCDQQPSKFQDHSFVKLAFRASLAEIAQQKCNSCAHAELVFGGPGQAPLRPGPSVWLRKNGRRSQASHLKPAPFGANIKHLLPSFRDRATGCNRSERRIVLGCLRSLERPVEVVRFRTRCWRSLAQLA